MRLRLSFQGTILAGCLAVVLATLVFVAIILQNSLREQMLETLATNLKHNLVLTEEVVGDRRPPGDNPAVMDKLADQLGVRLGFRVTIIDKNGVVLGDSKIPFHELADTENHAARPEVIAAYNHKTPVETRYSTTLGKGLMYAATLLDKPNREKLVIRLAMPLAEVEVMLGRTRNLILSALLLGVLLSIAAAYFMARGISKPLKALTSTATAISGGDLSRRFRRYPSNEIGELGRAFDRMTDTIQDKIEAVTMTRDRLAGILRGMAEGVLVTDREGRILLTNHALAEMLDLTEDPVGKMPSEIFRNADLVQAMRQTRLSGEQKTSEIRTIGQNPKYLELTVVRLPATETGAGCVAVLHDVTEHRRTEEIRRDFVANVSHELRTPLTAIRGSAETLLDGALESPDFARRFVEMIRRQAERLENLSQDLLELAKVETGGAGGKPEMVRLAELADSVLSTVSDLAEQQGVELFSKLDDVNQTLWADRRQLEEAILNLMVNAIKYTDTGGRVTLAMRKASDQIRIQVIDTGMGIPGEHLPRIFERFYRVDKNRSREIGGTGLGLAIVKHLTQAQGGHVEVESEPGKGSTFSLVFDL